MKNIIEKITLSTNEPFQIIDITDGVRSIVMKSGVRDGSVTVFTRHTTTCININEREARLQEDMIRFLKEFIPVAGYAHDKSSVDGRANTRSHLMAMFTNASETMPLAKGELLLGGWQSIFFIELDGPREERNVLVQIMGE